MKNKFIMAVGTVVVGAISLIILFFGALVGTNDSGFYQVKQSFGSGKMTVINKAGMYPKLFGKITTYQMSDMQYFSKSDLDGGKGAETDAIEVRFNDGGTAKISGSLKYKLSVKPEEQLKLHEDYRSDDSVKDSLVRQLITEALLQTSTLMKAEEVYSTRRSEFTAIAEAQIKEGIYETFTEEYMRTNVEGNQFIERFVKPIVSSI